jgi:tetratricopeptide (TPR) repeat protein
MVGGSGLPTTAATRGHGLLRSTLAIPIIAVALTAATGCVYFNALYNANRLFDQGSAEIEDGRVAAGRGNLGASIEKAERIVANKPNSRWADDALRLTTRARILREEWMEAAESAVLLLAYAKTAEDSAEVAGYLGTAKIYLGELAVADSLLSVALEYEDGAKPRSRLLLSRARARAVMDRLGEADLDLREAIELEPDWLEPRIDRVRLLVLSGRGDQAVFWLSSLFNLILNATEEREVVALAQEVVSMSPATGLAALAEVESSNLLRSDRALLIKLRADIEVSIGDSETGKEDYQLAVSIDPDSRSAVDAQVSLASLDVQSAEQVEDLERPQTSLERLYRQPAARGVYSLNRLRDMLIRIEFWVEVGNLGYILAAETARDELNAPLLARTLLLEYANTQPQSLWAPKAILAVLDLTDLDSGAPEAATNGSSAEELRRRLAEDYGDSAYVRALIGGAQSQFTYEELESGLRRQLERLEVLADQEVRARQAAWQ